MQNPMESLSDREDPMESLSDHEHPMESSSTFHTLFVFVFAILELDRI